jgi:hypothetical protein
VSRRAFFVGALVIFAAATALRTAWLRADPPTFDSVGVVWHDEGAWTHNARNQALWGVWRTDQWNPVFVAPVFTALEYVAFREFGVGIWQARTVSVAAGLLALACFIAGLAAAAGRRAALIGGALLATDYVFVMWNRAALMESTMTALIVVGWAAYAVSERRPLWGGVAGAAAVLAWFTKASAAFFIGALMLDAMATLALGHSHALRARLGIAAPAPEARRAAWLTLAGLAITAGVIIIAFVLPHWSEYRFYNWQTSVMRKPDYDLKHILDRASWLPIVQGFFSRMWLVLLGAAVGLAGVVARWRTAKPAERLLVLWVLVGLLELVVHDSGNDRRYVMFIPALIALASMLAGSNAPALPPALAAAGTIARWLAVPLVLLLGYLVAGSAVRLAFLDEIGAGRLHHTVWVSAALSGVAVLWLQWRWTATVGWLAHRRLTARTATVLLAVALTWNVTEYARWAMRRTHLNYQASVDVGARLPAGTLVQGILANGLSLENRIHPIFIGNGFGNYADRLQRDDVRYILTYVSPAIGYETPRGLIKDMLDSYANWRIVTTFDVTPFDGRHATDRAALIDKNGSSRSNAR